MVLAVIPKFQVEGKRSRCREGGIDDAPPIPQLANWRGKEGTKDFYRPLVMLEQHLGNHLCTFRSKGLVIHYGDEGLQNGKIVGPKLFARPLKTGWNILRLLHLKGWNSFVPTLQFGTSSTRVETTPAQTVFCSRLQGD